MTNQITINPYWPKSQHILEKAGFLSLYFFMQIHSMDFDDTWHPATHPSGAILPALTALSEALPQSAKFSGLDLLLAFNVGIEVQGRLMHFSKEASDIPKRYGENFPRGEAATFLFIWLST